MRTTSSTWVAETRAMIAKEVRSELRTRHALATMALFAVVTQVVVSYNVPLGGLLLSARTEVDGARILSALLWIVLLFSSIAGLARVFLKEEDARTTNALRLSARASVVFTGKLVFNAGLMAVLSLVVLPLFSLLFSPPVARWDQLVLLVLLGDFGLAGATTLLAALVARTDARGGLFAVLAVPVLVPLLTLAIDGTAAVILGERAAEEVWRNQVGLAAYTTAMITVSLMLFPVIWED